jgi:hypothetical protein
MNRLMGYRRRFGHRGGCEGFAGRATAFCGRCRCTENEIFHDDDDNDGDDDDDDEERTTRATREQLWSKMQLLCPLGSRKNGFQAALLPVPV